MPNPWRLEINICRVEGIGRFYIGLAEHIRILEDDDLKKYASEYAKKFLMS